MKELHLVYAIRYQLTKDKSYPRQVYVDDITISPAAVMNSGIVAAAKEQLEVSTLKHEDFLIIRVEFLNQFELEFNV